MKKLFCAVGLIVLGIGFLFAQEQKTDEIRLTLHECLEIALEKNLDISVSAIDPEIQEFSLRRSKEFFWPQLTFGYNNYRRNQLGTWWVQGTEFTTDTNSYSFGVEQNIVTGGRYSLSLSQIRPQTQPRAWSRSILPIPVNCVLS